MVILAAVGIAVFGYYQTEIASKHKTVLQVGETKFSLGHFERRLRLTLRNNTTLLEALDSAPIYALSELELQGVLFEGAPRLGVDVSEEDVDVEIRGQLGLPEGGDERTFASLYGEAVRDSGLHTDEYRSWLRASLLGERMWEKFRDEAPPAETQVRARLIQVETEEEAREVIRRLEGGEDFVALAGELSLDEVTKENGGDTDWLLRGEAVESVEEFLFTADVGARSEPLAVTNGYFVVELLERQDEREISEEQKEIVASRDYEEWIQAARASLEVVYSLEAEDQAQALANALEGLGVATSAPGGVSIPVPIGEGSDGE